MQSHVLAMTVVVVLGMGAACGRSSHGDDDDDAGSSGEGGSSSARGGSAHGGTANGGTSGASAGRGGTSRGGNAGTSTSGAAANGDSGDGGESGTDNGGESTRGGSAGFGGNGGSSTAAGSTGLGGSGGIGPRPPFRPKVECYAPRWLTTVAQPREGSDPLAVTNGLGVFMATWLTSEDVNATDTWSNGVVSMERDGLYPNPLDNTVGQGTNTHVDQLAMGKTGDAIWLQDPGVLGNSDMTVLRRWDQAATTWDAPHVVSGMRAFGMRATFLDDHDILVAGPRGDQMSALVYDRDSETWSEPVDLGSLGSALPTWASVRVGLAADGAGNAAVVWANAATSKARVMRARQWVGTAVSLNDDTMVQGFWDVAIVPTGSGNFEVITGPQDETRGVIVQAMTLGYSEGSGSVLGEPVEAGRVPQANYIGAGQPFMALRDLNGDITVGSAFWTDRPEFWVFRRIQGAWTPPLLLADGNIVANDNIGMGLRSIALDSAGHALAVTANDDDELVLRETENGSTTWTDGIRIDTTDFRFNRRGASLVMDGDEPVIFFSADDALGTNGNVAWTACHR